MQGKCSSDIENFVEAEEYKISWGAWLVQLEKHATLDRGAMISRSTLAIEMTQISKYIFKKRNMKYILLVILC